jgi:4-aminobutyrate aminotransferase
VEPTVTQETATTAGVLASALLEERSRVVARGVTGGQIAVASAEGARLVDVDGRTFIDFAGGIACQNVGHRFPAVVDALHEQIDRYLHQCIMVATYEPYLDVCRRLANHSPCGPGPQKSVLVNSGAEAVENAVKIARVATRRPGVVVLGNSFHGRTLLTMTMTSKVKPYKVGGTFAPDVYHALAPYPYRGVSTDHALASLQSLFTTVVDAEEVACVVLEPVQGEGGFIPMPADFLAGLVDLCHENGILFVADEVQTGVGRTGRMWAIDHYAIEPDLLVSGKSLGGGLPLAAVTGPADIVDAPIPGGLGGTFGGNPLSCVAASAVLDAVADERFLARASDVGRAIRARLERIDAIHSHVGDVRGLGPMLAFECVVDPDSRAPDAARAHAVVEAALERGLIVLACGLYGNVVRLLPPLTINDVELADGLDILDEAVAVACAA